MNRHDLEDVAIPAWCSKVAIAQAQRFDRPSPKQVGAVLAAMLITIGSSLPARAADAPAADDGGTILVTANRRTENIQKVGTSIAVLSATELADHNVQNVYGLQYLTPSLQVTPQFGSGQPAYQIRGVGFNDYASNNAPAVGIYVDEVAYPIPLPAMDRCSMSPGSKFCAGRKVRFMGATPPAVRSITA
jgi:hypothetical protein